MKRLFWILLVLALYLVALMGCGLENIGKRQCYDVAWMDCTVSGVTLSVASAGVDLGATVTAVDEENIEGTVVVDGAQRAFEVNLSGICSAIEEDEQFAGDVAILLSYGESVVVRRQDFFLFSGEANVTATGDSNGAFTLEATLEDIGGEDAPPTNGGSPDDGQAGEGDETDDTRDITISLRASITHGTSQQCTGGD